MRFQALKKLQELFTLKITGNKNIAYVYAVAKDGTGFAGSDTITTADGTIIKGVVAKIPFRINSVYFYKQNVSIKNATYAAGLPVKPEVLIQIGGSTLVEGKDCKLELISSASVTDTSTTVTTVVTPSFTVTVQSLRSFLSTPHAKSVNPLVVSYVEITVDPS